MKVFDWGQQELEEQPLRYNYRWLFGNLLPVASAVFCITLTPMVSMDLSSPKSAPDDIDPRNLTPLKCGEQVAI